VSRSYTFSPHKRLRGGGTALALANSQAYNHTPFTSTGECLDTLIQDDRMEQITGSDVDSRRRQSFGHCWNVEQRCVEGVHGISAVNTNCTALYVYGCESADTNIFYDQLEPSDGVRKK
jgi:hypothetical protein